MTVERSKTYRGFQLIKFSDRYNSICSLQQSSLAEFNIPGASAVWLGVDVPFEGSATSRMHLDRENVEWLIKELQHWLDTGSFRGTE